MPHKGIQAKDQSELNFNAFQIELTLSEMQTKLTYDIFLPEEDGNLFCTTQKQNE